MKCFFQRILLAWLIALPCLLVAEETVDFNLDIRPILSDKCFHCHGPDAQNQDSEFRVDTRENAVMDLGGTFGVVPGNLDESEVHHRIRLPNDDFDVMPPLDSNRVLSRREKDLLDAWIKQGAPYDLHWAFKPPVAENVAPSADDSWARNPIDVFVRKRLQEEGIKPSKQADLETMIRRASLTLTGLSPALEILDEAIANPNPDRAYEKAVDHFLSSIHYAERQTLRWLDAARYADTDGYQNDSQRENWPWRDWVIQAYDQNLPFDQFTIEQIAGDMLPEATTQQILASAFNRNHRQNSEGGALAAEFYVENVIDRVETTSTVWLGLTMGCARCHDHKYDPLSQREFYQFFAYFNNIGEKGIGKGVAANPTMDIGSPLIEPSPELAAELVKAKEQEAKAQRGFKSRFQSWLADVAKDASDEEEIQWSVEKKAVAEVSLGEGTLDRDSDGSWLFSGQNVDKADYVITVPGNGQTIAAIRLDAIPDSTFGKPRQLARSVNGNFVLTRFQVALKGGKPLPIASVSATFEQDNYPVAAAIDDKDASGWAVFRKIDKPETVSATFTLNEPIVIAKGASLEIRMAHHSQYADHNIGNFQLHFADSAPTPRAASSLPPKVQKALDRPEKRRSKADRKALSDYFKTIDTVQQAAEKKRVAVEKKISATGAGTVPVMVMQEKSGDRMPAYLLARGQYDAPVKKEELPRAIPAAIFAGSDEQQPDDRLELARWLVSNENPLTARVIVNRIWQDHFGIGLVKTAEDFGAQGEVPAYHELLDWLAVRFVQSGWDTKALHRLIVTSATYRQSSVVTPELHGRDPMNRLLARGPRFRLDGFSIRDNALFAADLLNQKVGGPPVKPYQPTGLWKSVANNPKNSYQIGKGSDLFRKSLYTYWKRAVNPPRQLIFDAGGREACSVAMRRTNTPLQALALMNDVTFIEAARNLAESAMIAQSDPTKRLNLIFRTATSRHANSKTLAVLQDNLNHFKSHFVEHPDEADSFLAAGETPRNETLPAPEHAAWTAVAHLVLNLDKTITIE